MAPFWLRFFITYTIIVPLWDLYFKWTTYPPEEIIIHYTPTYCGFAEPEANNNNIQNNFDTATPYQPQPHQQQPQTNADQQPSLFRRLFPFVYLLPSKFSTPVFTALSFSSLFSVLFCRKQQQPPQDSTPHSSIPQTQSYHGSTPSSSFGPQSHPQRTQLSLWEQVKADVESDPRIASFYLDGQRCWYWVGTVPVHYYQGILDCADDEEDNEENGDQDQDIDQQSTNQQDQPQPSQQPHQPPQSQQQQFDQDYIPQQRLNRGQVQAPIQPARQSRSAAPHGILNGRGRSQSPKLTQREANIVKKTINQLRRHSRTRRNGDTDAGDMEINQHQQQQQQQLPQQQQYQHQHYNNNMNADHSYQQPQPQFQTFQQPQTQAPQQPQPLPQQSVQPPMRPQAGVNRLRVPLGQTANRATAVGAVPSLHNNGLIGTGRRPPTSLSALDRPRRGGFEAINQQHQQQQQQRINNQPDPIALGGSAPFLQDLGSDQAQEQQSARPQPQGPMRRANAGAWEF